MLVIFSALLLVAAISLFAVSVETSHELKVLQETKAQTVEVEYIPAQPTEYGIYILPDNLRDMDDYSYSVSLIAQTIWGEARGLTKYEQSCVAWCILNRLDTGDYGETIEDVVTASHQFVGWKETNPVTDELYSLAEDVMLRWCYEKYTVGTVGRTLPALYLHFRGDGAHNYFFSGDGTWTMYEWNEEDPYGDKPF